MRLRELGPADWGVALVVAVLQLVGSRGANASQTLASPLDWWGYVLLAIGPAALLLRRRLPLLVLFIAIAAAAAYVTRYGYGPIFLSLVVAFLTAAVQGSRWPTYALIPAGYLFFVWPVPALISDRTPNWWAALGIAAWLTVLVAAAEGIRQRRAVLLARRQRKQASLRSAEEERLRRASEERLAIARELHDVLAHSLSLINVQSSVALELLERKPEQAATALAAIKTASRDALGEVHSLLNAIRTGADRAPTAPAPSIADLDAVVERARSAGIAVRTSIEGKAFRLPSVVDVAAARIIQESLTNVARHSTEAAAVVTVQYSPTLLVVQVDNGGSAGDGRPKVSGGNGIRGMIERARALGGELSAGPRRGGGFRVEARLPIGSEEDR
ncbi:sensor histidine kinase [Antrihabitans stalactiti]|uniref:histidine kinase n=1 Tax=Antrihabitans stalactiti TaxID=2584121 RepID=A0A848KGU6_9NOCA|nr:sensor histidine kinase [Antrihabitans stalactiti]NMN96938.1 sensor histidine kinase [Antrihabitans stalactiti]